MSKKKTALEWVSSCDVTPPKKLIAWLKRQPAMTMNEFYRDCSNVAWIYWALTYSRVYSHPYEHKNRTHKFYTALCAFEDDAEAFMPASAGWNIAYCDSLLSKKDLAWWADLLRLYITPR